MFWLPSPPSLPRLPSEGSCGRSRPPVTMLSQGCTLRMRRASRDLKSLSRTPGRWSLVVEEVWRCKASNGGGDVGQPGESPGGAPSTGGVPNTGKRPVQVGPRSAQEGRRWAVPDCGTQSRGPESQGAPSRRRGVGSPEALGGQRPRGYFPATGEGVKKTPQRVEAEGNGVGWSGARTVQKECGRRTGL